MAEPTQRWFTWDREQTPNFWDFLDDMREQGWWYQGGAEPMLTPDGIDCQFVWDDLRGDPPPE